MYELKCFWGIGKSRIANIYCCENKEKLIEAIEGFPFIRDLYPNISLLKGYDRIDKLKPGRRVKIPMGIGYAVIKRLS